MWIIGINQLSTLLLSLPKEVGGYGFSRDALSYMYFAPIIGILVGAGLGRFVIDFACNRYIQHHNGVYAPEARIPPTYFATLFLVPGLVLFGQALAFRLSWVALAAGWILYVIGGFMSAVATTSYLVDFYTAAAAQISTILSFARLITGFSISYFQVVSTLLPSNNLAGVIDPRLRVICFSGETYSLASPRNGHQSGLPQFLWYTGGDR